jgi:N-acetylmuramic acid 6-phosphate etherase
MTVPSPDYRDPRLTEQRNPRTQRIDVAASLEIVDLINAEDATVAPAVYAVRQDVARAIDLVGWSTWARGRPGGWACWMRASARRRSAPRPRWWWG